MGYSGNYFANIPINPIDEGFVLLDAFKDDNSKDKVSLGAGVYRCDEGKPWVLPIVRKVEQELVLSDQNNHEYLPIRGHANFLSLARDLVFGTDPNNDSDIISRIASFQTISGTGANLLGAYFLTKHVKPQNVWISDPSWPNHHLIWELAGPGVERKEYPYYSAELNGIAFDYMVNTLEVETRPNDVLILHPCAQNPTGHDLSHDQWRQLADLCIRKNLLPFFDCAYQGFASGDIDQDAWAIRHFVNLGLPVIVAYSFSKNFGLYGERVGALHVVTSTAEIRFRVESELTRLQRGFISNPPSHGAKIVAKILGTEEYRAQWLVELQIMVSRLRDMRKRLLEELSQLGTPGQWQQLTTQIGMFSYTGLTLAQVEYIKKKYHIYIYSSGRISIAGLNTRNIKYVAKAIDDAVRSEH